MGRKTGTILSYVLLLFETISTLLVTPVIIRTLGASEYGVYRLTMNITSYLLLLDLGIGNSIVRFVSKFRALNQKEEVNRFLGVTQAFYFLIAFVCCGIGIVVYTIFPTVFSVGLSPTEMDLGQALFAITMLNAAFTLATAPYPCILNAYERFALSKLLSIAQITIRMIVTYVALFCGYGSFALVVINFVLTIVSRSLIMVYIIKVMHLHPVLKGVNYHFVKEIVTYSIWILLQSVATQVNSSLDSILLGVFVPSAAAVIAVYSVGSQLCSYFHSIGEASTGVTFPGIVRLIEQGANRSRIEDEMIRLGRLALLLQAPILGGFLLYGKQFIQLWAGTEYLNAYIVAALLMLAYMFTRINAIGSQFLMALNEHKEQSAIKIIIVLLNVILTISLIQWDPIIGATIGTFISLVLGDVVALNAVLKKKIHLSIKRYYGNLLKGILPAFLLSECVGILISILPLGGWGGLAVKIAIYVILYIGSMYLLALNSYEKNIIKGMVSGIIRVIDNKITLKGERNEN